MLLILLLLTWTQALAGTLTVEVLDVGQGDSILLQTPKGKVVLIDAGEARAHVIDMLHDRGIEHLDLVIATHPHADHIGGMAAVLRAEDVSLYADNGLPFTTATYNRTMAVVENKKIRYRPSRVGQTYKLDDGIKISILNPQEQPFKGTRSDPNSNSVVARVTHGKDCFLFTGDSEAPTERAMLANGLEPCDVLKVAHHGGQHSTTGPFLDAVQPSIAVISVGEGNKYRHPRQPTLDRLAQHKVKVYRTDQDGTVVLKSNKRRIKVSTHPEQTHARPVVASHHAVMAPVTPKAPTPTETVPAGQKINISEASAASLQSIPGIGPSKAQAIIRWRDSHTPCTDLRSLDDVPGIGPATLQAIMDHATCGEPPQDTSEHAE